jgi:hypothetical protein
MKLLISFIVCLCIPVTLIAQGVDWSRIRQSSHFSVKDPFKNHWFANKKYDTMRTCIDTTSFYVSFGTALKNKELDSTYRNTYTIVKYFSDGVIYAKEFEFSTVYSIEDLTNGGLSMFVCFPLYDNLILIEVFRKRWTINESRTFLWGSLGSDFIIFHAYGTRTKLFSKDIDPDVRNAEASSICTVDFKETKPIPKKFILRDMHKGLESVE